MFVALASPFGACQNKQPVVRVDLADRSDGVRPDGFDRAALEVLAAEEVSKTAGFAFRNAKEGEIGWQLLAKITFITERTSDTDRSLSRRSMGLAISLKPLKLDRAHHALDVETVFTREEPKGSPFQAFAENAIIHAFKMLDDAAKLSRAEDEEIVAALKSTHSSTRLLAARIAGDRRLVAAVPRLKEMVKSDEEETAILAAIGALVRIGDASAVGVLIDAARHRPPAYLNQILFAVSTLGGSEAEAYLFTVSSGHPDPQVREEAKKALEELERRKQSDAPQRSQGSGARPE